MDETNENPRMERLLVVLDDESAMRLLAAWPHIKRDGKIGRDGSWGSVAWRRDHAAVVSGMSPSTAEIGLSRLRDLDLIRPDGTVDPIAAKALRALVGQKLRAGGNSRR